MLLIALDKARVLAAELTEIARELAVLGLHATKLVRKGHIFRLLRDVLLQRLKLPVQVTHFCDEGALELVSTLLELLQPRLHFRELGARLLQRLALKREPSRLFLRRPLPHCRI